VFWTLLGIAFVIWFVVVLLFTPRIDYHVTLPLRPDSDEFLHVLQSVCPATALTGNTVDVFTNGSQFYPAMRDAIRRAEASVNLEAYIFSSGDVADMLIDVLVERARAGVEVRLVLDALGSAGLRRAPDRFRGARRTRKTGRATIRRSEARTAA
jgi:cardiolipin synthase A/B